MVNVSHDRQFQGFTLWFTGLPSSGKTTLSRRVAEILRSAGYRVEILDGDEVRQGLSRDLGFSKADRDTHILRIGYVAKLLSRNGVIAIVAAISPYREIRNRVRKEVARFVEVYVKCPVDVCVRRDTKGLYAKAMTGEIQAFTGVSDPYEEPVEPELVLETDKGTVYECTQAILGKLSNINLVDRDSVLISSTQSTGYPSP